MAAFSRRCKAPHDDSTVPTKKAGLVVAFRVSISTTLWTWDDRPDHMEAARASRRARSSSSRS